MQLDLERGALKRRITRTTIYFVNLFRMEY